MTFRMNLPLLSDFTLEPMSLRTFQRQARVGLFHFRAEDRNTIGGRVSQHSNQSNGSLGGGHPEQRSQAASAVHGRKYRGSELRNRQVGNVAKRNRFAAVERRKTGRHLNYDQAGARLREASASRLG